MHIVIDARIINSSTGRYVERLLHYLQKIDTSNRYTVLVRAKDEKYWTPTSSNFTVKVAEFDNYSFAEQFGYKRFLDDLNADLVHFCMPQQPVLYKGTKVTTVHDLTLLNTYNSDKNWFMFRAKQWVGGFVFKHVGRSNRAIITPTNYTKDAFVRFAGIPADKVTVTYEAAEVKITKTTQYDLPFANFIMYIGQQPDYKNIRRLGDAHQQLLAKYPDLGLVLVGKKAADASANEEYFKTKNYKNIHFTGFLPDEQRDWLLQHTDAYVFPSLMEGFGLPGLEAMAAGAPVVSSNATCLPEVYGDAAEYFDPLSTEDMANSIERVLTDKKLRKQLINKGAERVATYSWERMARQTHEVYMTALSQVSE